MPVDLGTGSEECAWDGATLVSLVASAGGLTPAFDPAVTDYVATLPMSATTISLTPTVAAPTPLDVTITVNGSTVASGSDSPPETLGPREQLLAVVVTARSGRTRTYAVIARRGFGVEEYIKASSHPVSMSGGNGQFGWSVAIDGDTLVVGAASEHSAATGVNGDEGDVSATVSGAAYVFVRSGGTWVQQAYLKASNTDAWDRFGGSVAISGDTIVVGATGEASDAMGVDGDQSSNAAMNSGAAYVFERTDGVWAQQGYLKASNTGMRDGFGSSVAIQGDTIVVGAPSESSSATGVDGDESNDAAGASGAAYVFQRTGTVWSQQTYLKASNTELLDRFGARVAIAGDTIVVGAPGEDSAATGVGGDQSDGSATGSGAVYVFVRSGGAWSQEAYVKPSNTGGGTLVRGGDAFGASIAISGDTIVVGAPGEDSPATGIGGFEGDGADGDPVWDSGAAYVFVRTGTSWSQQAYVKASNTGGVGRFIGGGDGFGGGVAIDGNTMVIAAGGEESDAIGVGGDQTSNAARDSGAVYVFSRTGDTWRQRDYVKATNTDSEDVFGWSIGLSGNTLAIGTPSEDGDAIGVGGDQSSNALMGSGAVYTYVR